MSLRVLITGANGFLGKIVQKGLDGHDVITLDLQNADINCNIAEGIPALPLDIDLVIHCAGKAHMIPKTVEEKEAFFKVNQQGTVNLCGALTKSGNSVKSFVLISTVSVYGKEVGENIAEDESLQGDSPYALSKINAEKDVLSWAQSKAISALVLRLPLIVGADPPGNLGKMLKAIAKGRFLLIEKGAAKKSMVCADDIVPMILKNLNVTGTYNLTDGIHPSFAAIEQAIANAGQFKRSPHLPFWLAKMISVLGEIVPSFPFNRDTLRKMTLDLTFDDQKARAELGWKPTSTIIKLREIVNS